MTKVNPSKYTISLELGIQILKKLDLIKECFADNSDILSSEIDSNLLFGEDYIPLYEFLVNHKLYSLLLKDDSIICLDWHKDRLKYSFFQNPRKFISFPDYKQLFYDLYINDNDLTDNKELDIYQDYEMYCQELEYLKSKVYVRYDYSLKGYSPLFHSQSHLHIGWNSSYRIPINRIIYPASFINICLKSCYFMNLDNKSNIFRDFVKQSKVHFDILGNNSWSSDEQLELYFT